jgi:uncharacterized protein (DUF427 family)
MSHLETWTFEGTPLRVEPSPRRVRVRLGDETVAGSDRAMLLVWYGPGRLPTYCLPAADVRTELLSPSPPAPGDDPMLVPHDVRTPGGRAAERAALLLHDPPGALAAVDGLWTFTWDGAVTWLEEATEVHVHARDPQHRVDVVPSDRHVRVEVGGQVVAESHRPHALFETTLPTRWYLPAEDVDWSRLVPSDTSSTCPFKGTARYWSIRVGDELHEDLAWSYPDPIPECPGVTGLVCFFDERVDTTVDGRLVPRPRTPWSPD